VPGRPADELLTRRELEVVRVYLSTGSVQLVAGELRVSTRTVESHLARARSRAQVQTTSQLVDELHRRGEL